MRAFLEKGTWPSCRILGEELVHRRVTAECLEGMRSHVMHMTAAKTRR
jgi:hypothetical protein